jgi:hypothetical protein
MQPIKFDPWTSLSEWLSEVTHWPPSHKSTKAYFDKHFIIINLVQSAQIFRIQNFIAKLKIKKIIQHWGAEPEKVF